MDLPIHASFQRVCTLKGIINPKYFSTYTLFFQLVSWSFNKFMVCLQMEFLPASNLIQKPFIKLTLVGIQSVSNTNRKYISTFSANNSRAFV